MTKYLFVGDSWAEKAWTHDNYQLPTQQSDIRLADFWPGQYTKITVPGQGNLALLDRIQRMQVPDDVPIIWVYTEPGRDHSRISDSKPHSWMQREDLWQLRAELDYAIINKIKTTLTNPIAFIGGLSDVPALSNIDVLYPSWQQWIADKLNSQHFVRGWGASDIGWRAVHDGVTPSRTATFAWDEQIKEWCWWEQQGYFCHEHPSPRANQEFAEYLQPQIEQWLKQYEK
jgi:hypothetical protein